MRQPGGLIPRTLNRPDTKDDPKEQNYTDD